MRKTHHRCTGSDDRADIRLDTGDYALGVSHQHGIGRLVALHGGLGPGLVEGSLGGLEGGVAPLQLRRADEALVAQLLEALEVSLGLVQVGLRGRHAGARGILTELEVLRVELG